MSETLIISGGLFLVAIEIFRNWCIVDVGGTRPHYWWSNVLRVFVAFVYWVTVKCFSDINQAQWWAMLPMICFGFWFLFDYGFTQFRNLMRRLQGKGDQIQWNYLNPTGSWADVNQSRYLGWTAWFYIKLVMMAGSTYLFIAL